MTDYERIEKIIRYLDERQLAQPGLAELANVAQLSPFQLQRMFARLVRYHGISLARRNQLRRPRLADNCWFGQHAVGTLLHRD